MTMLNDAHLFIPNSNRPFGTHLKDLNPIIVPSLCLVGAIICCHDSLVSTHQTLQFHGFLFLQIYRFAHHSDPHNQERYLFIDHFSNLT